jgi:hypothetical protein
MKPLLQHQAAEGRVVLRLIRTKLVCMHRWGSVQNAPRLRERRKQEPVKEAALAEISLAYEANVHAA